ncbi:MAG: phosphate ABC transporter substrate-binding protein [Promethearchaeota archaeon]
MERRKKIVLSVVIFMVAILVAWIGVAALTSRPKTIKISGSTTCLPIIQACTTAYEEIQTEVGVTVTGGGSSVGVKDIGEGNSDIGMTSRPVKTSELEAYPDIQQHAFARDGVAIIVNPANPVNGLTLSQIKQIYEGKITNWKDLGGNDAPIVLMGRDSASGTRETFETKIIANGEKLEDSAAYEQNQVNIEEYNSNGGLHDAIAANPNAIGYIGIGYIDSEVKALTVNGIRCTEATVKSKKYPIARKLYLLTLGAPDEYEADFINFVLGEQGQAIVQQEGFVKL